MRRDDPSTRATEHAKWDGISDRHFDTLPETIPRLCGGFWNLSDDTADGFQTGLFLHRPDVELCELGLDEILLISPRRRNRPRFFSAT
jgi:hypothetical protein